MPALSLLTHVFNAPDAVLNHIANWLLLSEQSLYRLEFLIVDDCSDVPLQIEVSHLPVRHFRITTDIPWNMAGAKNLLRTQAASPWLLFFDVDNLLPAAEIELLLANLHTLNPDILYMFQRAMNGALVDSHVNTFLIHRNVLDSIGGFDEDFCGHYGYEDVFFQHLLAQAGINRVLLTNLTFLQGNARTETLNRDLCRNMGLIEAKASQGEFTSTEQLRFKWIELGVERNPSGMIESKL